MVTKEDFIKKIEERASGEFTDKDKNFVGGIYEACRSMFEGNGSQVKKEDIDTAIRDAMSGSDTKIEGLETSIREMLQDIAQVKTTQLGNGNNELSIRSQYEKLSSSDEFKRNVREGKNFSIELRAATTITTANAANAKHLLRYEVIPGIQEAPREDNAILPVVMKGGTNSRTIYWVNRVNKEGGSAFIAEGTLKPLMDWEYNEESSEAKKIAVRTKVSTEMLFDNPYMESEIRMLMQRDLMDVTNEKLLTGLGNATEIKGITVGAAGYTGTGLDGTIIQANNVDAIRAGILQLRLLNYRPDVLLINPTEAASLDLLKTETGHYIRIEVEGILRMVRIIETANIPIGKLLLLDSTRWFVRVYEQLRLEFGWENDDFSKNLVTVIAEMRLHSWQNSIDAGSVLYDDFATIKAALQVTSGGGE